jgi:hypothetical protein
MGPFRDTLREIAQDLGVYRQERSVFGSVINRYLSLMTDCFS